MAKVVMEFEVEVSNEVSANELKAWFESLADDVAEDIMGKEGVVSADVKKVRIVL